MQSYQPAPAVLLVAHEGAPVNPLHDVTLQVAHADRYSGLVNVLDLGLDNQVSLDGFDALRRRLTDVACVGQPVHLQGPN